MQWQIVEVTRGVAMANEEDTAVADVFDGHGILHEAHLQTRSFAYAVYRNQGHRNVVELVAMSGSLW